MLPNFFLPIYINEWGAKKNSAQSNKKLIVFFGVLTEIIYLMFYFIEPLRKKLGDENITLKNDQLFFLTVLLLFFSLLLYILVFNQAAFEKSDIKLIIGFFLLFNITLLFVWPVGSYDIFSYIYQSRVLSEHHANPLIMPYSNFSNDAFYYFINNKWSNLPTPYGPLFIFLGYIITTVGGNNLILTLFLFKIFFAIINVLSCILIYKIFNSIKAVFLYGWNPLILYEIIINGHNDILTIFLILLCFYFLNKKTPHLKKYYHALLFLLLSILIKFITIIFLPIFILIILAKIESKKEKIYFICGSFLITIFIFFVFYFPFWSGMQTLLPLYRQSMLVDASIILSSPIMIIIFFILRYLNVNNFLTLGIMASKIIFVLFYLLLITKIYIKRKKLGIIDIFKFFFISLLLFYLSFLTWFVPWYFTILISLLICYSAKINEFKFNKLIYGISLYGILYYLLLR